MKKLPIRRPNRNDKAVSPAVSTSSSKSISFAQGVSLAVLAGIVLLAASGYYWYNNVLTNPDRILSGMLDKSLQTTAVDRTISQTQGDSTVSQDVQTTYGPQVASRSVTNLSQITSLGRTKVVTETIGTQNDDYVRYTDVTIDNPTNKRDFKDVLNTWGTRKNNPETGEQVSFLNTALFVAVPFGNLNVNQRNDLNAEIKKNNLYKYKEAKLTYEKGRPVMTYTMDLNPKALVTVLAKYAEITGIGDKSELNPAAYEGVDTINVKLSVDALSRHIKTIEFVDSARTETYHSYNAASSIVIPNKTIPVDELQSRLSAIEGQGSEQ